MENTMFEAQTIYDRDLISDLIRKVADPSHPAGRIKTLLTLTVGRSYNNNGLSLKKQGKRLAVSYAGNEETARELKGYLDAIENISAYARDAFLTNAIM